MSHVALALEAELALETAHAVLLKEAHAALLAVQCGSGSARQPRVTEFASTLAVASASASQRASARASRRAHSARERGEQGAITPAARLIASPAGHERQIDGESLCGGVSL